MRRRTPLPVLALLVGSCGWNHLPQQGSEFLDEPLWDANGAVATAGALYVRLPAAGALARLAPGEEAVRLDLGEGRVTRIAAAPGGQTVVAFVERYLCDPDDPREARRMKTVHDCHPSDLEAETEIALVQGTDTIGTQPVDGAYNAVEFSDDGRFAVAYVDFSQGVDLQGVVNLTGVVLVDLAANTSQLVTVGFAPDQVLFSYDDGGNARSAVVLSRNQVANLNLLTDPVSVTRFPLTLDPDTIRDPTGVVLTPDGRYALISTRGSADLYAIDLVNESINIVDLSSAPSTIGVDSAADRTVLVYGGRPVVEVMEHDFFEVDTIDLDEGMNRVTTVGGTALLWSTSDRHDFYRLALENNALVEYRIQNPMISLHVAPTAEFAVALTRAEGGASSGIDAIYDAHPGMEIIDLADNDSEPFILEGLGLGVAFASDKTNLNALVLQQGIDYLFRYDLYARQASEIELSAPPVSIGTLSASGRFWITHESPLGLVSFLDPASGQIVEVSGFARLGLLDPIELSSDEEGA